MNTVLYSFVKNKQDHKRILCICLCLLVFFTSLRFVHAESNNVLVVPNYVASSGAEVFSNGLIINEPYISSSYYQRACCSSNENTFIFGVRDSSSVKLYTLSQEQYTLYRADNQNQNSYWFGSSSSGLGNTGTTFEGYYHYDFYINTTDGMTFNVPIYDTVELGVEAVTNYINNPPQLSFDTSITIRPGYAAYILTEGGEITLTAYQNDLSSFSSPLWLTRSRIAIGVNRPSSGFVYDSEFGSLLNWQKDSNYNSNIFGQTHYSTVTYNDLPSDGTFVAIYNPLYSSFSTNRDSDYTSPVINVHITNGGAIVQYPIKSSFNGSDLESSSTSDYAEYYLAIVETNGAITDNDYEYTDNNGTTTSSAIMSDYGDNEAPPSSVNSIGDLLRKIVDLLSAPIEHIQKLYNAAVDFFTYLTQLWSWLPPEVTTIIGSALAVLVVIGVVKFLWK